MLLMMDDDTETRKMVVREPNDNRRPTKRMNERRMNDLFRTNVRPNDLVGIPTRPTTRQLPGDSDAQWLRFPKRPRQPVCYGRVVTQERPLPLHVSRRKQSHYSSLKGLGHAKRICAKHPNPTGSFGGAIEPVQSSSSQVGT